MNEKERKQIGDNLRYELRKGTHTFTMCKCKRRGARSGTCWECWLELLEEDKKFAKSEVEE